MRRTVKARAFIKLVKTEEGGRRSQIPAGFGYRPDHSFDSNDGAFVMGELTFAGNQPVQPGDLRDAEVKFVTQTGLLEEIQVGSEWKVHEGARIVGQGRILEILEIEYF